MEEGEGSGFFGVGCEFIVDVVIIIGIEVFQRVTDITFHSGIDRKNIGACGGVRAGKTCDDGIVNRNFGISRLVGIFGIDQSDNEGVFLVFKSCYREEGVQGARIFAVEGFDTRCGVEIGLFVENFAVKCDRDHTACGAAVTVYGNGVTEEGDGTSGLVAAADTGGCRPMFVTANKAGIVVLRVTPVGAEDHFILRTGANLFVFVVGKNVV